MNGNPSVGSSNGPELYQTRISLKNNECLTYNANKKTFEAISHEDFFKHSWSNMRRLSKKVSSCTSFVSQLDTTPLFNLSANVRHFNKLCGEYDARIEQSRLLRFLDRVIRIITCGLTTLKYTKISTSSMEGYFIDRIGKTPNGFIEPIKWLTELEAPHKFEFSNYLVGKALDKSTDKHLNDQPFVEGILLLGIANFSSFTVSQKRKFLEIAEKAIAQKMQFPEWNKAPIEEWTALIECIASQDREMVLALRDYLCKEFIERYDCLKVLSKQHVFSLLLQCDPELFQTNRKIEFGLMKFLIKDPTTDASLGNLNNKKNEWVGYNNNNVSGNTKKALLDRISSYPDLTEKEERRLIEWLKIQRVDLFDRGEEGFKKFFNKEIAQKWLVFLTNPETKIKLISECSKFVLQLCYVAANNGWQNEQSEDEIPQIPRILQHLNLGCLVEENHLEKEHPRREFSMLTKEGPLSIFYKQNPDLFLSNATEEQLELFYSDKEKTIYMDPTHIKIPLVEKDAPVTPPLPKGITIDLDELNKIFAKLDFKNKKHKNYVSPGILIDDGILITPEIAKANLEKLTKNLKEHPVGFYGAPADPVEHQKFYQDLELAVKHIIYHLRNREPSECSAALVQLAIAGNHCGGRFIEIIYGVYGTLTGQEFQVEAETLEAILLHALAKRRAVIFEGVAYQYELGHSQGQGVDVHALIAAKKYIGSQWGIDTRAYQYKDRYERSIYNEEGVQKDILRRCEKDYFATVEINEIAKYVNGMPGHMDKVLKGASRELVLQWHREHMSVEKTNEMVKKLEETQPLYEVCIKELMDLSEKDLQVAIKEHINKAILKPYGISLENPTNWKDVEAAINAAIKLEKPPQPIRVIKQNDKGDGSVRKALQEKIKKESSREGLIKIRVKKLLEDYGIPFEENNFDKWEVVKSAIERVFQQKYLDEVVFVKGVEGELTSKICRSAIIAMLLATRALTETKPDKLVSDSVDHSNKKKYIWKDLNYINA